MDARKRHAVRLEQVEFEQDKKYGSFLTYLSNRIAPYDFSLKIISNEPKEISDFKRYKDSFIFTYIYTFYTHMFCIIIFCNIIIQK